MQNLVFAPITKVKENDDGTCEVYGTAAAEVVDKTREILDYALSKPQFEKWRDETLDRSQGKSLGNIRSMHGKIAAGKVTAMDFDDAGKVVNISTHIVDPVEAQKCILGVYTGFSVGGSYARRWPDPAQKGVMRYTPSLSEISIVDNPCVHSATFQHIKMDGAVELCKFAVAAPSGFSRRRGRLEKPEHHIPAHPVPGPGVGREQEAEKVEKVADQPRSAVSRFAAGKTEDGSPHFGNILRGKAIKAKADGDALGAATYSADAASHDAFAEGTPEAHDKAAAAHTAAAKVHKDGNSPVSALLHTARAAHHKNEADSKRAVAAQKCTKCGGDMASGKCEKCEKAVGVGVSPQPAPFTQSFTNTDPTSVTTDFRGPAGCKADAGGDLEKGGPGSGPHPGGGKTPTKPPSKEMRYQKAAAAGKRASLASMQAEKDSKIAAEKPSSLNHSEAAASHGEAGDRHMDAAKYGNKSERQSHTNRADVHYDKEESHLAQADALRSFEGKEKGMRRSTPEGDLSKSVKCPNCGADIEDDYCDACDRKLNEDEDIDEELERMFLPRYEGFEKLFADLLKGGPGSGPHPGYTHAASVADAASKAAKDASQKVRDAPANQKEYEHQNASDAHAFAAKEHGKAADLASTPQERFRHSAAADEHSARAESHKESRDKLAARSRR